MARQQASLRHGVTAAGPTHGRCPRSIAKFRPRSWSDATSSTRASSSLSTTRRPALLKSLTRAALALPRCRSSLCSAITAQESRASSTTSSGGAYKRLGSRPRTTGVFAAPAQQRPFLRAMDLCFMALASVVYSEAWQAPSVCLPRRSGSTGKGHLHLKPQERFGLGTTAIESTLHLP